MTDVKLTPAQRRALEEAARVGYWRPKGSGSWQMARTLEARGFFHRAALHAHFVLTGLGREVIANG